MIPELQRADLPLQPRMDERQEERAAQGRSTGGRGPQRRHRRQLRGPSASVAAAAAAGANEIEVIADRQLEYI